MRHDTLLAGAIIMAILPVTASADRIRQVPIWDRLGEYDAVLYGEVSSTQVIERPSSDGTRYQAVVEVTLLEVYWDKNNRLPKETVAINLGVPGTKGAAMAAIAGVKQGQRDIWGLEETRGWRRYEASFRRSVDKPDEAKEVLKAYRERATALAPYRQALLRLDVAPGNAIAEVPIQLALRWEDVDQAGVFRDAGAPNVAIEARVIVSTDAGGLTPERKYRVHVTSIRPTTVTEGKARRGIIRMSARMIGVERALEEKEPSVEPVQRCEVRAVVQLPDGGGRLASPWAQVAVIRPVLHDDDKKLMEEISGRQLWGLIGPHKQTLSENNRTDLEGMLVRYSESFLAPAIRCGLAFGTTGHPVERAAELRALSADAGFGWRDECLLKAYALLRDAKKDAEAGEVAAELAMRCRIESEIIKAAGSGRDHAPDSTSDTLPTQQEGQ